MSDEVDLLKRVYDRFNARDMEAVLASMHEDVMWANGMEGGHVHDATKSAVTGHVSGR
jgi:ketosteroid isomerase-like protein